MTDTQEPEVVVPNTRYALLPLRDVVVFPYMVIPLFVGREKSIRALESAMEAGKQIFLAAQFLIIDLVFLIFPDASFLLPQFFHLISKWVHLVFNFHALFFESHVCHLYFLLDLILGRLCLF